MTFGVSKLYNSGDLCGHTDGETDRQKSQSTQLGIMINICIIVGSVKLPCACCIHFHKVIITFSVVGPFNWATHFCLFSPWAFPSFVEIIMVLSNNW